MKKLLLVFSLTAAFSATAQLPFVPLKEIKDTKTIQLPEGLNYSILFSENDTVLNRGNQKAPAKGNHDYNAFLSNGSSEKGILFVGHETNSASDLLGDGGGATVMTLEKKANRWAVVGDKYNIDFSNIGGTLKNCSGAITSDGRILSAEEFPSESNNELFAKGNGYRDTSDFQGLKRWQNMGWMVEIDPFSKRSIRKLFKMGRFSHEAALVMPDKKTVYLTDDYLPSVFFKFVCENENDFTEGKLYAYSQSSSGLTGTWLALPMDMNSLLDIRNVAIKNGASMFARIEWITMAPNGIIYMTETGADNFSLDKEIAMGGKPAVHFNEYKNASGYDYPYGSVLAFDPEKKSVTPYIRGGKGKNDLYKHFSNPDAITNYSIGNKNYLVISEDLIASEKGRTLQNTGAVSNEIWWLDLAVKNPTVDDLQKFMTAPLGAEATGGFFTPDGSSYFLNIQHPNIENPAPFNRSTTIVITGFKK